MVKIISVKAREILDSRGNPTVEAEVRAEGGILGIAAAPSGASTGIYEALELRDGDEKRYGGKGVLKAVAHVNGPIAKRLKGMDAANLRAIDGAMIRLDGTPNKSKLGANATSAVSMAVAKAGAAAKGIPLYKFLGGANAHLIPVPMMNVLNGGKHAGTELSIQEFMVMPIGAKSFSECLRMSAEVYHALGKIVQAKYGVSAKNIGDEGGYAPNITMTRDALDMLVAAIEKAGYSKEIRLAMDPAASSFFDEKKGTYFVDRRNITSDELVSLYVDLVREYPIISIEDGLAENDWEGFASLTKNIGGKVQIVGDDLFVTNVKKVREGITRKAANAMLLKVNQIGTISEATDAAKLSFKNGWNVVVSHRSGETSDDTIADLSVALGCGQLKAGAPARGERVAKYNRLLKIEEELGSKAKYAGKRFRGRS